MSTTRLRQHVNAPRPAVYRALLDPRAVRRWMVPDGMTSEVHTFDAREGGAYRVSLTYEAQDQAGKTTAHTDTHHGRFVELVPNERVVQLLEFETSDPAMQGEMRITFTLADADGGTEIVGVHEGVPPGVRPEDNELGWRMSLGKLAALVEAEHAEAQRFLLEAIELARENVRRGGRPFGAVVVQGGEVIARGVNETHLANDPTAHAELLALREAGSLLGTPVLAGCTVYASGHPCPMCLAAMLMACVDRAAYAYSLDDGAPYGLTSAPTYAELAKPPGQQRMPMVYVPVRAPGEELYEQWAKRR